MAPSLQNLLHNNATLQNHQKLQWIFSMLHLLHQGIENGNGLIWILQAPCHPCWNIICDCSVDNFIHNMLPEEIESIVKNMRQLKYQLKVLLTSIQMSGIKYQTKTVTFLIPSCSKSSNTLQDQLHNKAALQNHQQLQWIIFIIYLLHRGNENRNGDIWML